VFGELCKCAFRAYSWILVHQKPDTPSSNALSTVNASLSLHAFCIILSENLNAILMKLPRAFQVIENFMFYMGVLHFKKADKLKANININ